MIHAALLLLSSGLLIPNAPQPPPVVVQKAAASSASSLVAARTLAAPVFPDAPEVDVAGLLAKGKELGSAALTEAAPVLKKYQEALVNEGVPVIEKTLKEDVAPTLAKTADALTPVAEKAAPVLAKGITQTLEVFLDAAILPALSVLAAFIAQSGSQAAIAAQDLLAKYSAVAGTEVTKAVDQAVGSKISAADKATLAKITEQSGAAASTVASTVAPVAAEGAKAAAPVLKQLVEFVLQNLLIAFSKVCALAVGSLDGFIEGADPSYVAPEPIAAVLTPEAAAVVEPVAVPEPVVAAAPEIVEPVVEAVVEAAVEPEVVAEPVVEAAPVVEEAPAPAPVFEAPAPAPVFEAPPPAVPEPIFEAPAAATPNFAEREAPMSSMGGGLPQIPEKQVSTAGSEIPWGVFGAAFTVFPAAVIGVSEGLLKEKPAKEKRAFDRDAGEIFSTGMDNLMADDSKKGWLFGEPSALYSNAPEPKVEELVVEKTEMAAAEVKEEMVGVVTPVPEGMRSMDEEKEEAE